MRSSAHQTFVSYPLILALLVVSCGDSTDVNELNSELVSLPETLVLEGAYVGYEKSYELPISSKGDLPLNFQAQVFSTARIFELAPVVGAIPANGTTNMSIKVTPDRLGTFEAILILQTDATRGLATARINITLEAKLPPDCEDGNGCTINRFNPVLQKCEIEFREGACDDRNFCTEQDQCISGECIGEPVTCNDNDFCTDDVCNPTIGCVFPPTRSCDDNNPCTIDRCLSPTGCEYEDVEDGTLCDDFEACTMADVCVGGNCRGVNIPNGTPCDDGDPCSKNEVCDDGICIDESYTAPDFLDIKFETTVENLGNQASQNPIIDNTGNIFLGTQLGVVALDICGDIIWRNDNLGASSWKEAASLPGVLFLPLDNAVVSVDSVTGDEITRMPISSLTSSTSTVVSSLSIRNMVVSGSGKLLIAMYDEVLETTVIHEYDPSSNLSAEVDRFTGYKSHNLAVTLSEELVATFVSTTTTSTLSLRREELHVKYDLLNRGLTWTSSSSIQTELPHLITPGEDSELYSSEGIIYDTVANSTSTVFAENMMNPQIHNGGVVVDTDRIIWLRQHPATMAEGKEFSVVSTSTLGEIQWTQELPGDITDCFPAVGRFGDIFVGTRDGGLSGLRRDGTSFLDYLSAANGFDSRVTNPTLTPQGVLVFSSNNKVIGIQISSGLSRSIWPRYRRDNFSSGHQ